MTAHYRKDLLQQRDSVQLYVLYMQPAAHAVHFGI